MSRPATFCSWKAAIYWNVGNYSYLNDGGRSDCMFEEAMEQINDTISQRAKATTGDKWPVHITLEFFNFHTEETE